MLIPIDEVVYFDVITSAPTTGAATDADSTPTFAVYEESTDTDIGVGGNLTKRTSLTGNYRGTFTASAANGFEAGKWYAVIASATVGGVAGKTVALHFRAAPAESSAGVPKVDMSHLGGASQSATDLKDFADDGYDPSTNKIQGLTTADAVTVVNGLANNVITAAAIANGAIDAATFAADTGLQLFAPITSGLLQDASAGGVLTLASGETGEYAGCLIRITSGVAAGQAARTICSYNSTNKQATIGPRYAITAAAGDSYVIYPPGSMLIGGAPANLSGGQLNNTGGAAFATAFNADRLDAAITTRLAPTTAGRTLDVSSAGNAGIDWSNIEAPTTVVDLSGTTVDAAGIRTAIGLASANLDTQLADIPTVAEFNARTVVAADYATNAQSVKLLAAVYDSASLSGSVVTLSNGAALTYSGAGRVRSGG